MSEKLLKEVAEKATPIEEKYNRMLTGMKFLIERIIRTGSLNRDHQYMFEEIMKGRKLKDLEDELIAANKNRR